MATNGMGMGGTGSAGSSWISTLIARMPYSYHIIQNAIDSNPKYDIFNKLVSQKEQRGINQSVQYQHDQQAGSLMIDKRYHQFMYADVDSDKIRRIQEYRKMAAYAELADCIEEIADEAIVKNENEDIIKMDLFGEFDRVIVKQLKNEWNNYIQLFNIEDRGFELLRKFLTEGELYFENIISANRPEYGVIHIVNIPTEIVNPVYDNVQNHMIKGFLLKKPVLNPESNMKTSTKEELIFLDKNQVTYIHSGLWNEDMTIRLPYIENSRRAYKQLSLVEDSIIIYRLVRAPERLVFKVDVGNMPVPKAEEYIKKLMQQYWSRKNFDGSQGRVTNVYDPQSMLDAYWFAKRGNSEGTTVEQLAGGCLAMDTKIPLLDGRELTLSEMTKEYNEGKQNWVYSCNPENGNIVPGKVSWAGVTQKSAKVMKLTFENGESLVCTPDHKFPTILNGKKRADELNIGESLYSLHKDKQKVSTGKNNDYEVVYQPNLKKFEFTHRIVKNTLNEQYIKKYVYNPNNIIKLESLRFSTIHHVDYNRYNNDPTNLILMDNKNHTYMHSNQLDQNGMRDRMHDGMMKYYDNITPEARERRAIICRKNWEKGNQVYINKLKTDKVFYKQHCEKLSKTMIEVYKDPIKRKKRTDQNIKTWSTRPERRQELTKRNLDNWSNPEFKRLAKYNMSLHFTEISFKNLVDLVKETKIVEQKQLVKYINNNRDNIFLKQFITDNPNENIWKGEFTLNLMKRYIRHFGYKNYSQFRREFNFYNHKIINIEYLSNPIEVGTLTIDKNEEIHNYHTFATSTGAMTYNSNLGSLEDLMYFVKKMYKSLKVPVSRLDPADAFKDGTEITREELRFSRFIVRIQQQMAQGFKQGFITHLKLKEKRLDDPESKSLWEQFNLREHQIKVRFNTPTNFAIMREQQIFDLKSGNYGKLVADDYISKSFAQKYYLGWTDNQMIENREWLRKDAILAWEIQQLTTNGPDFRKNLQAELAVDQAAAGAPPGGGSALPAGGQLPPGFGPGPDQNAVQGAQPETPPQQGQASALPPPTK